MPVDCSNCTHKTNEIALATHITVSTERPEEICGSGRGQESHFDSSMAQGIAS